MRRNHLFHNKLLRFPANNVDERKEWMRILDVAADIDSELRASIIHFHVADIVLFSESDDINSPILDISVQKDGNTRYPFYAIRPSRSVHGKVL